MSKRLKFCALLLGSALVFGCANQKGGGLTAQADSVPSLHMDAKQLAENDPNVSKQLVKKAKSAIGTPYVLGGSKPGGFDCSGLVKWAFNSVGVELPRTAREQSVVGEKVKNVKDMRAGDIVAFRHPRRGYHTGIYVGNGKFVHSPRTRSSVRIASLSDPYFRNILLGARRISMDGSENLVAQAERRLRDYVEENSRLSLSKRNLEKIRNASRQRHIAHKSKSARSSVAKNAKKAKQSVIAQKGGKSVKKVAGKIKANAKNRKAHAKLASASKKASHKAVSMLSAKKSRHAARAAAHRGRS